VPIFTYETPSGLVDEIRPLGKRDAGPFKRVVTAPYICRGAANPDTSVEGAKRFFREKELRSEPVSHSYTKKQLKKIWEI